MRFAIVADVHAFDGNRPRSTPPSHFNARSAPDSASHVLAELIRFVDANEIEADYLVCCGDMGDKADPFGASEVWSYLEKLRVSLGAARLIATAGNHDVDSRHSYNDYDGVGTLQGLSDPSFPVGVAELDNEYWARHVAVIVEDGLRLVVLNSAAYHGVSRINSVGDKHVIEHEFEHGRIAPRTVDGLLEQLAATNAEPQVNLLLVHHHLLEFGDSGWDTSNEMHGGPRLMKELGSSDYGEWLIVHGHTHAGKVGQAPGSATAPFIFAAGSLAATSTKGGNQFYVVDIDPHTVAAAGLDFGGTFESWDLRPNECWAQASDQAALPWRGGFGRRSVTNADAMQIKLWLETQPDGTAKWQPTTEQFPWLRFFTPDDLTTLVKKLEHLGVKADKAAKHSRVVEQFGVSPI